MEATLRRMPRIDGRESLTSIRSALRKLWLEKQPRGTKLFYAIKQKLTEDAVLKLAGHLKALGLHKTKHYLQAASKLPEESQIELFGLRVTSSEGKILGGGALPLVLYALYGLIPCRASIGYHWDKKDFSFSSDDERRLYARAKATLESVAKDAELIANYVN